MGQWIHCEKCDRKLEMEQRDFILTGVDTTYSNPEEHKMNATIDWQCPNCKANLHAHLYGHFFSM